MGRKRIPSRWIQIMCEQCGAPRTVIRSLKKQIRFCNRSCSNKWQHANGIRKIGFDPHKSWLTHVLETCGPEIAAQRKLEHSNAMSVAIKAADMSLQKEIARSRWIELNRSHTGMTLEEIYGAEKATAIKQKLSDKTRGAKNPAYGKVYMNGGKSVKGHYKGMFFRSLLEYSFMKHLESEGISLSDDVDSECFTIPYVLEGRERTYHIDFYVKSRNVVYEIKQSYVLNCISLMNEAKWRAAEEYFTQRNLSFVIMTEIDFPKISFDVAKQDLNVVWHEKTFKFFKANHEK